MQFTSYSYLPRLPGTSSIAGVGTAGTLVAGGVGSDATASGTDTTIELVAAMGEAKP